jgi:hypothetical protein
MRRFINALSLRRAEVLAGVLSLATFVLHASTARALSSFDMEISPYVQVLGAVDDAHDGKITMPEMMAIIMDASWDNPNLRIRARNKPAFMLINTSTSPTSEITSLSITLAASNTFTFGDGDMAMDNFTGYIRNNVSYNDPGVTITGSSLTNGGKTLTVNFDGLTVGKRVLFNTDFDTSAGFPYPDFRTVLFGAPALPADLPSAPASYVVNFDTPAATIANNFQQMTETLEFASSNIRPYSVMDMVEHIPVTGQVPEPGTAVLAIAAVGAFAGLRRRLA